MTGKSALANARCFAQQTGVLLDMGKALDAVHDILWDLVHTLLADDRASTTRRDVAA